VTDDELLADPYLRALYCTAYERLDRIVRTAPPGPVLEIGAGSGLAARLGYRWWGSDVTVDDGLDLCADARALPLADASISALVLKDALHHVPDVARFLDEAQRVLVAGGVIAVFDPYWGRLAALVYRHLHQEPFDDSTPHWSFRATSPWESNQALSFLLLERDADRLTSHWPGLVVERGRALVGPSFLLSGGVSRRTRVSGRFLARLLEWEERRGPWFDHLRFFHVFALRKVGSERNR